MSVPKDKRKPSQLEISVLARKHAKYVLQITSNPTNFDPQYRDPLISDMQHEAIQINRLIWSANNVRVGSNADYKRRRGYQEEAGMICNNLLADIEIAKTLFHIESKRVKNWVQMVVEIRNLLRGWIKSDADRYKEYR